MHSGDQTADTHRCVTAAGSPPLAAPRSLPPEALSPQPATRRQSQRERVLQAIDEHDIDALRHLAAQRGGFCDRDLRTRAWCPVHAQDRPILLRSNAKGKGKETDPLGWDLDALPVRDDERQVRLDIDRSLVNFPHDVRDEDRDQLRIRLERAILTVLRRRPALHYFQGYHDIISVLLLTLEDEDVLIPATERLSLHVVRDSMGPGLEPTLGYLKIVHRLVKAIDPELYNVVSQAASMPFFALSWALTLLSHDLDSVAVLARLFDFLLAHNPSMICHLVVAILLTKKDDLLSVSETCEGDPAIIHSALSQLPTIVLSPLRTEGSSAEPENTPSSPSPTRERRDSASKAIALAEEDEYTEDLMSSASFMESSSDLARSPTLTASSSVSTFAALADSENDDLDASMISTSEIQVDAHESIAGLRRRRRPSEGANAQGARTSAMSPSLLGYEADNDRSFDDELDSLHALDESMFSDPDIEGLAFQPFPTSSSRATEPMTPPRETRQTSRSGNVVVSASSPPDSPSHLPPRRTVVIDELIQQALELSHQYPVLASPAPGNALADSLAETEDSVTAAGASDEGAVRIDCAARVHLDLQADRVLGPNSCVHTWSRSMDGTLTDDAAETIVRAGEGIVFTEALGPDADETETVAGEAESLSSSSSLLSDDDDLDDADADADEYDFVSSAAGNEPDDSRAAKGVRRREQRRRRRRHRHSSNSLGARLPPLLALGPHGWLVVSGVAVAAVAYGVYRQQGNPAPPTTGAHGLGTAGLGLGFGFGAFGAGAGGGGGGVAAVPAEGVREAAEYVAGTVGAATVLGAGGRLV
ncbi:hypothetical protein JCM3774_001711 [Rhodotorula dairenensis]